MNTKLFLVLYAAIIICAMYRNLQISNVIGKATIKASTRAVSTRSQYNAAPPACTTDKLETIRFQLPPFECLKFKRQPYQQKCSYTRATKCPEPRWLTEHYAKQKKDMSTFLAIYVNCNKGMDAVNTLRMGSRNANIDKKVWTKTFLGNLSDHTAGVCKQEFVNQFPLSSEEIIRPAEVHCIEPLPVTVTQLNRSVVELGWQTSLHVHPYVISGENGVTMIPKATTIGVENHGIDNFDTLCSKDHGQYTKLITYHLDTFISDFAKSTGPTHLLSIDVEGYDAAVLKGGADILQNVQYLEFVYNWMGAWKETSVKDIIKLLDNKGFTCYWAGMNGHIWRITGCWMDQFDIKTWSNMACVNRNHSEVAPMAVTMENMFLSTLALNHTLQDYHSETDKIALGIL